MKPRKMTKKTSAKCVGRYSGSYTEGWIQLKGEFSSRVSVIANICWKHRSVDPPISSLTMQQEVAILIQKWSAGRNLSGTDVTE